MDVHDVEFPPADQPAQTEDPAGIPRRPGTQAAHRPAAVLRQGRSQRRFSGQEVRHGGIHAGRIAVSGALDQQSFGAARTQPFNEPKDSQGTVILTDFVLCGDHAR